MVFTVGSLLVFTDSRIYMNLGRFEQLMEGVESNDPRNVNFESLRIGVSSISQMQNHLLWKRKLLYTHKACWGQHERSKLKTINGDSDKYHSTILLLCILGRPELLHMYKGQS